MKGMGFFMYNMAAGFRIKIGDRSVAEDIKWKKAWLHVPMTHSNQGKGEDDVTTDDKWCPFDSLLARSGPSRGMASVYICHWRKEVSSDAAARFADLHDITLLLMSKTCNVTWQSMRRQVSLVLWDQTKKACSVFTLRIKLQMLEQNITILTVLISPTALCFTALSFMFQGHWLKCNPCPIRSRFITSLSDDLVLLV